MTARNKLQGYTNRSAFFTVSDVGAFYGGELDALDDLTSTSTADDVYAVLEQFTEEGKGFGATVGGGGTGVSAEFRVMNIDNMRTPIPGATVFQNAAITMNFTLKEFVMENIQRALPMSYIDPVTGALLLTNRISEDSYIPRVAWAGDRNDGAIILMEIFNALETSGFNVALTDNGEATLPVTFTGHDTDKVAGLPIRIRIFTEDGVETIDAAGLIQSSASSSLVLELETAGKSTDQ
jgi:hypothetical protein